MKKLLLVLTITLFVSVLLADVPALIDYQGRLTNNTGAPLNGNVTIEFKIYSVATVGTALWTETQTVSVNEGWFQVSLGAVTVLNLTFEDATHWLGINVSADGEMTPRTRITSVAYAINAGDVYGNDIHPGSVSIDGYGEVISTSGEWKGKTISMSGDNLGKHTATGDLNMASHKITNLTTPTANTDAATKQYVDNRGDNLGNHTATQNIKLGSHYLSGDGGNEGVYITSTGNVGIGTTSPSSKLEVNGKIEVEDGIIIDNADINGVYVNNADENGFSVSSTGNDGVYIENAGGDGVHVIETAQNGLTVDTADYYGVYINSAGEDGLYIGQAGNDGVRVYDADRYGINVSYADWDGVFVNDANHTGVHVYNAGANGLYVYNAGRDGVSVYNTGNPTTQESSTLKNGFEVAGAEGNGLFVGRADSDGVSVQSTGMNGVSVNNAGENGFSVSSTGNDGVYIENAGGDGVHVIETAQNGLTVDIADYYGVYINSAGEGGVYISETYQNGLTVNSAGDNGVHVHNADNDGFHVGTAGTRAFYGNTSNESLEWGLYTPDKVYAYNITSRGSSTYGKNVGISSLEPGDIVCIAGGLEENVLNGEGFPVIQIEKATKSNSEAVFGVVEYKVSIREELEDVPEGETAKLRKSFEHSTGNTARGDYLSIIVFGQAEVKVESGITIKSGESLTVGNNSARKIRTTEINGITVAENVGILGKALEDSNGKGKIKVFVNCK
ncbi:MAG: hypothetical protein K8S23_02945 [Candidatus Cloacimonetes bacterium]|nr:hypothetical protein [Candidatus Cloacimonadota bacterium]